MSESMAMLDKIAQAIASAVGEPNPLCPSILQDSFYSDAAKAVLEAMRDPTDAMIVAGVRHENMGDMAGRWRAMIDAAISAK